MTATVSRARIKRLWHTLRASQSPRFVVKLQQDLMRGETYLIYDAAGDIYNEGRIDDVLSLRKAFAKYGPKFYCLAWRTGSNAVALDLSKQVEGEF